jgi:hypothetical protein
MLYPALENLAFKSRPNWSAGISFNMFTKQLGTDTKQYKSRVIQFYAQLKYSYTNCVFNPDKSDFNGGMHQVVVVIGGLSRKVSRIF